MKWFLVTNNWIIFVGALILENLKRLRLNDEQLKKLQHELLDLLIELDRICKKHNIPYFLYAGTLLGAVRHKGFIPWDDDIDVAMLRKDYERFKKLVNEELDKEKYFFQSQETDLHYNWVFARLRKNNTVYNRAGQEHLNYHKGLFIDIFPLDNLSENKIKQKLTVYMCVVCKKALWAPVGVIYGKNTLHRAVFKFLNFFPRKMFISIYEFFAIKFNKKETSIIISHNVHGTIYEKDWYKNIVELEFEGYRFKAPENYHQILEASYGDYMELPPENEREGHHYVSYIKFSDGTELKVDK